MSNEENKDEQSEASKVEEQLKKTASNTSVTIGDALDGLDVLLEEDVTKLPKETYDNTFRPYIEGEIEPKDGRPLGKWLEIAGGPTKPVDIVDAKGMVVERVPPLTVDPEIENMDIGDMNAMLTRISDADKISKEAGISETKNCLALLTKRIKTGMEKNGVGEVKEELAKSIKSPIIQNNVMEDKSATIVEDDYIIDD